MFQRVKVSLKTFSIASWGPNRLAHSLTSSGHLSNPLCVILSSNYDLTLSLTSPTHLMVS